MNNDVELIVKTGVAEWYTSGLTGINTSLQKIYLDASAGQWLGSALYQQLIDDSIEVQVFNSSNVLLDTVTISGGTVGDTVGTLEYLSLTPTAIASGTYFMFVIGVDVSAVLELYLNETISQNWRFSDLQSFAALGSFSRQFRIPATQNNCEAIGYLNDVNFDADIDYMQTKLPAEIRVQTMPIASGYLRVIRVITQGGKLADFEVTFYAESPDLFTKVAGKKLKDIQALVSLNAVLDYNEVVSASGYPYLYSLSDYGQKWDQTGTAGSRSIYTTTIFGAPRAGDLTPSLNWQWIFQQIMTEAGFTYEGPDLDDVLLKYYAPWINSKNIKYVDSVQSYAFKVYNSAPISMTNGVATVWATTAEDFDNGSTVTGNTFTAPITGLYTFRYWYTFTSPTAPTGISFRFFFQNLTTGASVQITETFIQAGTNNWDSTNQAPPFFLSDGDQFRVAYIALSNGVVLEDGPDYSTGTGLELIDIDFMDGATIDWAANAPDVTQADFLRDVLNMHCCVIVPDRNEPNKLIVSPIKDYVETGPQRDWSKKLDISKDITLTNTTDFQNKRLTFTYTAGEDVGSKIYTTLGRIYGDYKIENYTVSENDVPNDFARDSEQKVQLTTQSTVSNYIDGTSVVIPKFVDSSGNFISPKLRCLFHAGDAEMTLFDFDTSTPDTSYVVPLLNHYEFILPFFNSLDLNWAPEVPLYIQGINPVNNLFNVYWREYLNQLYSPNARIMEAYFALELTDILSFTFADRIWVVNSWWRILEISDYKIGSYEVTKVILLKLIDAVPETAAIPDGVDAGGIVEFVDGAGDPTSPTQDACERYGYTWDPITQSCYAFTSQPQNISTAVTGKGMRMSTNEVKNAANTIVLTNNLDNDTTNVFSLAVGTDITLAANNATSVAVGEKLTQDGSGGVAMYGRNVYTENSGLHWGGGYRDGDNSNTEQGWAQSGTIILHRRHTYTASLEKSQLFINGIPNSHMFIPDESVWSCIVNVTAVDTSGTYYYTAQLNIAVMKTAGVQYTPGVDVIQENGNFGTYLFGFEQDTSDPAAFKLEMKVTGTTFPITMIMTASVLYQQSRIA
jgi:hypothetical protein